MTKSKPIKDNKDPTSSDDIKGNRKDKVSKPISKPKPNPTVCYYPEEGGLALTATDLESLAPDQWITDQVVALELSRLEDDLGKSPGVFTRLTLLSTRNSTSPLKDQTRKQKPLC